MPTVVVMSLAVLALYVHSTRLGVVVPGARVVDQTVPNIDLTLRPFAHLHDRRTSYEVLSVLIVMKEDLLNTGVRAQHQDVTARLDSCPHAGVVHGGLINAPLHFLAQAISSHD